MLKQIDCSRNKKLLLVDWSESFPPPCTALHSARRHPPERRRTRAAAAAGKQVYITPLRCRARHTRAVKNPEIWGTGKWHGLRLPPLKITQVHTRCLRARWAQGLNASAWYLCNASHLLNYVKGSACYFWKFAFPPLSPPSPLWCNIQSKTGTEPLTS